MSEIPSSYLREEAGISPVGGDVLRSGLQPPEVRTQQTLNELWGLTGIPAIQAGEAAIQRGEYGPGAIQQVLGATQALSLLSPFGSITGKAFTEAQRRAAVTFGLPEIFFDEAGNFTLWHGTGAPPFSRFKDDYLMSGFGANAIGVGHYAAQVKEIAESPAFTSRGATRLMALSDGTPLLREETGLSNNAYAHLHNHLGSLGQDLGTKDDLYVLAAIKSMDDQIERIGTGLGYGTPRDMADLIEARDWLDKNSKNLSTRLVKTGGLLELDIQRNPEDFMLWNKRFAEQSPEVQERAKKIADMFSMYDPLFKRQLLDPDMRGSEFYENMVNHMFKPTPDYPRYNIREYAMFRQGHPAFDAGYAASKLLDKFGIAGNRIENNISGRTQPLVIYTGKEPLHELLKGILNMSMPPNVGSVEGAIRRQINYFKTDSAKALHGPGGASDNLSAYMDALHFFQRNKGNFEVYNPPPTYNYVVFNPNNMKILTRDGIELPFDPVEHDPFNPVTRKLLPPTRGNP